MRRDDQAVDLLIAIVGERKNRPVIAAGTGPHLDAADDAVGAWRGGHLNAVAFGVLKIDRVGQIDCLRIAMDIDRFDRASGGRNEQDDGERGGDDCT